jgi:hypothetical protein
MLAATRFSRAACRNWRNCYGTRWISPIAYGLLVCRFVVVILDVEVRTIEQRREFVYELTFIDRGCE